MSHQIIILITIAIALVCISILVEIALVGYWVVHHFKQKSKSFHSPLTIAIKQFKRITNSFDIITRIKIFVINADNKFKRKTKSFRLPEQKTKVSTPPKQKTKSFFLPLITAINQFKLKAKSFHLPKRKTKVSSPPIRKAKTFRLPKQKTKVSPPLPKDDKFEREVIIKRLEKILEDNTPSNTGD
jgi:hypothetical protein